jgi:hypothetical protein
MRHQFKNQGFHSPQWSWCRDLGIAYLCSRQAERRSHLSVKSDLCLCG